VQILRLPQPKGAPTHKRSIITRPSPPAATFPVLASLRSANPTQSNSQPDRKPQCHRGSRIAHSHLCICNARSRRSNARNCAATARRKRDADARATASAVTIGIDGRPQLPYPVALHLQHGRRSFRLMDQTDCRGYPTGACPVTYG